MRKLHADIKGIKPLSSIPQGASKLWESNELALYYTYDANQGEITWIMVNKTNQVIYACLLRGATLNINGQTVTVPNYLFGDAFAEVYFANGLSSYINSLQDVQLYSLAIVNDGNKMQVAFVFQLPPNGVVQVPEYGFVGLQSVQGNLVTATPGKDNLYAIIYDYMEILEYENEAGVSVTAPPDPYAVFSYSFNVIEMGYPITRRVIFEIPEEDVNTAKSMIKDLKGIFSMLKKAL